MKSENISEIDPLVNVEYPVPEVDVNLTEITNVQVIKNLTKICEIWEY